MSFFKSGEKPREQYRLPQGSFIHADQWMDYLSPEQYCWWLKFHSWVDRTPKRFADNHVPRTLESVFKSLGVSQATFYRKIKPLWETGLIEIVEFELSEKTGNKPRNIIVYEYPFNNAEFEYKPLEKRRDWKKDYASQSKLAGIKGGLMRRLSTSSNHPLKFERVKISVDKHPLNSESMEKSVDNYHPLNSERVNETVDKHPLNSDRVEISVDNPTNSTLSDLRANKDTNNIKNIIKERENKLNLSLINLTVDDIKNILTEFDFSEGDTDKAIELLYQRKLFTVTKDDIFRQAQFMFNKISVGGEIRSKGFYFANGVEQNLGRIHPTSKKEDDEEFQPKLSLYNWLED